MLKKISAFLLIALLFAISAFASPEMVGVENAEEITQEAAKEGTASLAATYTEGYFTYSVSDGKATITDCDTSISGDVVIPATIGGYPVTSLGDYAFNSCGSLVSITIPDRVTSIGDWVFSFCGSLANIAFGNNSLLASIGEGAFSSCTNLVSIEIPASVTRIGGQAFDSCDSLVSIEIPDSVTSIGYRAFYECRSLESIEIPASVTRIGEQAFCWCDSIDAVYISNLGAWCNIEFEDNDSNPLNYANDLYVNNKLATDITIPDGVTSIGDFAFYNCKSLENIEIPDSVKSIGDEAFRSCCNLSSIEIPAGVTSIGDSVFEYCDSLAIITVDCNNANYSSDKHGVLFDKDKTTLIQYPAGNIAISYVIPNSVTSIGYRAFYECRSLESIEIPCNVTNIGDEAVFNCINLASITFGADSLLTRIGQFAFYGSYSLTCIEIPDSVTSIDRNAFNNCIRLEKAIIYNENASFGNPIFFGCPKLMLYGNADSTTQTYANENSIPFVSIDGLQKYTITYDPNGGNGELIKQNKFQGIDVYISRNIPRYERHKFLGWSVEQGGEIVYNAGDEYTENADIVLYAVWEEVMGDASGDGEITNEDITIVADAIFGKTLTEEEFKYANVYDEDDVINIKDLIKLAQMMTQNK